MIRRSLTAMLALTAALAAQDAKLFGGLDVVDVQGNRHHAGSLADAKFVVIAWTSLGCPMSKIYRPRLNRLAKEFHGQGVRWLMVHCGTQDDLGGLLSAAADNVDELPVIHDVEGELSDRLAATRTTEVVVLAPDGREQYRGAIDDQYGFARTGERPGSYRREKPRTHFLHDALTRLLDGRPVGPARTDPLGCALDLPKRELKNDDSVTFHRDVLPILQRRCQRCHHEGGSSPFALESYDDAEGWADTIAEVTNERRMPPWNASPDHGQFANDARMTPREVATLQAWADNGAPEGDASDAPPALTWNTGWQIGQPDEILSVPEFEVPAEGRLPYRYVRIRTDFDGDRYVEAAQIVNTEPSVVHHVLVFMMPRRGYRSENAPWRPRLDMMRPVRDAPRGRQREFIMRTQRYMKDFRYAGGGMDGYFLSALPGDAPTVMPEGTGLFLPKGATLVVQVHYTPNGKARKSQTKIGLRFSEKRPERFRETRAASTVAFEIPPEEPAHKVRTKYRFPRGGMLYSLLPHMHLRGKSFSYDLHRRDGTKQKLLLVPHFDFDWQLRYHFAEPVRVERGDTLWATATFDNSEENPANPDPTESVFFGLQTEEEMMIGYFEVMWDDE